MKAARSTHGQAPLQAQTHANDPLPNNTTGIFAKNALFEANTYNRRLKKSEETAFLPDHKCLFKTPVAAPCCACATETGFFYEPTGATCPAQYFYWVNFQQFEPGGDDGIYAAAGGLLPGLQHSLPSGVRRVSKWVPVQDVLEG